MKFLELISVDEKVAAKAELELTANTASLQVDFDILGATKAVATAKAKYEATFKSTPFYPGNNINAKRDLADATETLNDLKALKAEYFSTK